MKNNLTELVFILDQSGSMAGLEKDTIGGFNAMVSGRYVIDAKSIMGIFSLDLSKPIDLNIHAEDDIDSVMEALKPYMI